MENLENLTELPISSQEFIKNDWKLLKKLRNENYHYYALIKCMKCGDEKLVQYHGFIERGYKKCPKCRYYSLIGQTIGTCKILGVDHIDHIVRETGKKSEYRVYYKVQCIKCGRIYTKLYNKTNWIKQKECIYCNSAFTTKKLNRTLSYYKCNAKARNLEWNLTNDEFYKLITGSCVYCGKSANTSNEDFNGIDRIDSTQAYYKDNCVPCCTMCNTMKLDYSTSEFLKHIQLIYNHSINKGSTTIENTSDDGSEQSTIQANGIGSEENPEKD